MRWFLALLLLAVSAGADTLNDQLEDGGNSITGRIKSDTKLYHYFVVGTDSSPLSLDAAIDINACKGGLDLFLNPDFDGTNTSATYTLHDCPRATLAADYANECIPANFDPDGGGANTNIMISSQDSLRLWGTTTQGFLGTTITNGSNDQVQVTWVCNGK